MSIEALTERHYCSTCGHGYGVHQENTRMLRVRTGKITVPLREDELLQRCSGYPDRMGKCECSRFVRGEGGET